MELKMKWWGFFPGGFFVLRIILNHYSYQFAWTIWSMVIEHEQWTLSYEICIQIDSFFIYTKKL